VVPKGRRDVVSGGLEDREGLVHERGQTVGRALRIEVLADDPLLEQVAVTTDRILRDDRFRAGELVRLAHPAAEEERLVQIDLRRKIEWLIADARRTAKQMNSRVLVRSQ